MNAAERVLSDPGSGAPVANGAPEVWDAAVGALRTCSEAVLCGHVRPDGDALGSMLALAHALDAAGVPVVCVAEPDEVPGSLRFLPGIDRLVPPGQVTADPPLLVTLDASSPLRIGALARLVDTAAEVLVIDHHASNAGFGTIPLIDPAAAATGMLVAELVSRLGTPLTAPVATCLYTAIASDTGGFRHPNTGPQVHELAARLLAAGVDHDRILRTLFDTHPDGWLTMLAAVLDRTAIEPDVGGHGLVWTSVTAADLTQNDLALDQAESVIDVVRTACSAQVAAVFKQIPGASGPVWTVSTRSRGTVDVGQVCTSLGGGGHRLAAGYTARGALEVVVQELRAALAAKSGD